MPPRLRLRIQLYVIGAICVGVVAMQAWNLVRSVVALF